MLAVLAERAGRVVEAEEIAVAVWGEGDRGSPHLARNVVSRLRRKLEPDPKRPRYIVSASAGGYLFSPGGARGLGKRWGGGDGGAARFRVGFLGRVLVIASERGRQAGVGRRVFRLGLRR